MKMRIGVIATFLMLVIVPFVLAQHGGAHFSGAGIADAGHNSTKLDQATGIQREAFAYCMTTADAARKTGRQMGSNSYWNAKHGIYDLNAVYRGKPQLQLALTDMAAAHQQFLKVLSQDQNTALGPNLSRLEQLQTGLNLEMSQLNQELRAVRPDRFRASTSVYEIGKTLDKWRSEHKRIAKKMSISKP
jgi:G:T/U-mismatch repair DNA glycosylase